MHIPMPMIARPGEHHDYGVVPNFLPASPPAPRAVAPVVPLPPHPDGRTCVVDPAFERLAAEIEALRAESLAALVEKSLFPAGHKRIRRIAAVLSELEARVAAARLSPAHHRRVDLGPPLPPPPPAGVLIAVAQLLPWLSRADSTLSALRSFADHEATQFAWGAWEHRQAAAHAPEAGR